MISNNKKINTHEKISKSEVFDEKRVNLLIKNTLKKKINLIS